MIAKGLQAEIGHEYANTRKILERVPFDKLDWQPHPKSMPLGKLAAHVANIPGWLTIILSSPETDVSQKLFSATKFDSLQDLLANFDAHVATAQQTLAQTNDEQFMQPWTFKRGDIVFFTLPKIAGIRSFAISHIIHHRAQLQVYLRMLDIPVPGFYGPSADEI